MKKLLIAALMLTAVLTSCQKAEEALTPEQEKANVCSFARAAELGMVEYTVIKTIKANDVPEWYKIGDRKILFSCKATLKAGIDMADFADEDVQIDQAAKQVTINLPHARLLNLDIKPEDTKLLYQKVTFFRSEFSAEERNKLLAQGEKDIRNNAEELGILQDAEKNAQLYFEAMLHQMGYENVVVNFKKAEL